MWIVRLALRRPYTFVVMSLLLIAIGVRVILETPTDILPNVDIPVISIVWSYNGLPAQQMERQITQFSESSIAGNTPGISALASTSFDGIAVIRAYLHPDTDVPGAMAQITATSQTIVRRMPPGTTSPSVLRYSASSVPILQLAFDSDTMSEAEIFDYVNSKVRPALSVIRGTRFPFPAGGKSRQIVVDLDLEALRAVGLSPQDVNFAIGQQNLTLPTGTAKMGELEYRVSLNSSPEAIASLNNLPIRQIGNRTIFVRDVAFVHDGYGVQTNLARRDGSRAVVLSVMKTGEASTIEVARRVKDMLPMLRAAAPPALTIDLLADQSTFVTNAIEGLIIEGAIAAVLTAMMILIFLGSWRSTLIVAISIPLSALISLLGLRALGYTINVSTLGGLALAVGILVDDATVEIENIHRNLAMGKRLTRAILDGAEQIAVPAFVASLSISVVFISVMFLQGPARYLFLPMGLAVAFAVMASYLLSRTIIPTLVRFLLPGELESHGQPSDSLFARMHASFERGFERFRDAYVRGLGVALNQPKAVIATFVALIVVAGVMVPFVGRDFFPDVDGGKLRLHVMAPPGTRLEQTELYFAEVERAIRELVPEEDRSAVLDFIGTQGGYNLAMTDSSTISSADGEILVVLAPGHRGKTVDYQRLLRRELTDRFPNLTFFFQPADIVTQILNFGLPSRVDVQLSGQNKDAMLPLARQLEQQMRQVHGAVDVRLAQVMNAPRIHLEVDRTRASEMGLTQRDVANNILLAVSSSGQTSPSYWTDPASGNSYSVQTQVPDIRIDSPEVLSTLGLSTSHGLQLLGELVDIERRETPVFTTRVNLQPTFNVQADVEDSDLGSVVTQVNALVDDLRKKLPPGATITVRGQAESMVSGFWSLALGLLFAALLVYGVMVINFQSWLDPFIIITALPGAAVGIVLALFVTQTTFSIPSLMGAVMSIGVATANSILVVTFANEQRLQGMTSIAAALEAGRVRLRPVLMTAIAMGIGMLPMSLGLSEGGEQNAALGRAVLGGLIGATLATLFFVPVVFSRLRAKDRPRTIDPDLEAPVSHTPAAEA